MKEFAEENSKFDENERKFSKRVENTVGKGEIAHYEQFLRFRQCFQKTCTEDTYKKGMFAEGLTVKEPIITIVIFTTSEVQDQAVQNMQSDLLSAIFSLVRPSGQKQLQESKNG